MKIRDIKDIKLAVIGLGYVGLPVAAEFSKIRSVVGFDIDQRRIFELESGIDRTNELSVSELEAANGLRFTSNPEILKDCNCYIITVPTPVDTQNTPDMSSLFAA